MLPFEEGKPSKFSYTYSYKPPTRVDYCRNLIKDSVLGKNENEKLRKYLRELLVTVISQTEGITAMEVEKIIEKRTTSLSPTSHQYLFSSNVKRKLYHENKLNTVYFLPRWLRRLGRKSVHQNNSVIDEILNLMESELEITNGK
jgi:hypothetical protein